jgi:hypothetical protein
MPDMMGIARTIDHAVYTLLNAVAIILWRFNAAILGMAMLSYDSQDWLTGRDEGGVWLLSRHLVGADGILGISIWSLFLALALILFGFAKIVRPFCRMQPVDLGRLVFFATIAHLFITQGPALMQQTETLRADAGSYVYEQMSAEDGPSLELVPASSDEPLYPPADLDGQAPLRGWEAVATSYFLVTNPDELHASVPPPEFRRAYCLYDPNQPINDQADENAAGCSPRLAWDEWDQISFSLPITNVWGIPLPGDISIDYPVIQPHPDNRQLGIRQAQAGVSRLALGPVVALFPMLEANVGLMLTLAASFIYLSLPITLLFGFFLYTEPMATRLMLQFISIFIRTLILQGLMALFLVVLMQASLSGGSLTMYLGLIGVGLMGGWFLIRVAADTMKETLAQSLGAVGAIWMGMSTGVLGEGARQPARAALGVAKLAASGATMVAAAQAGGLWRSADLADTSYRTVRSGAGDLRAGSDGGTGQRVPQPYGRLPEPLARMAAGAKETAGHTEPLPEVRSAVPLPASWSRSGGQTGLAATPAAAQPRQNRMATKTTSPGAGPVYGAGSQPGQAVEAWVADVYETRQHKAGRRQVGERGQALLGEELGRQTQAVLARHSQAETEAVLSATQQTMSRVPPEQLLRDGRLTGEGIALVQANLDQPTATAFSGPQGERDLATLIAAGMQPHQEAAPEAFRQATAQAVDGRGDRAAGRAVPRALGLDPVAAGAHFASLNRFARLSEQAGLSPEQRQRLLRDIKQTNEVSPELRRELAAALKRQAESSLKVEDLAGAARNLPETLKGPVRVQLPQAQVDTGPRTKASAAPPGASASGRASHGARPQPKPANQTKPQKETNRKDTARSNEQAD